MINGMPIKQSVYEMVVSWLDDMPVGFNFRPTDLQGHIIRATNGKRCPHDATITRYIRLYNEKGGSIECISRSRSTYKKTADTKAADPALFEMQEAARARINYE